MVDGIDLPPVDPPKPSGAPSTPPSVQSEKAKKPWPKPYLVEGDPDLDMAPLPKDAPPPSPPDEKPKDVEPPSNLPVKRGLAAPLPKLPPSMPMTAPKEDDVSMALDNNKHGFPMDTFANVVRIFTLDTRWARRVSYNEFTRVGTVEVPFGGQGWYPSAPVTNLAVDRARLWLDDTYGIRVAPEDVGRALYTVSHENSHHPVRDFLNAAALTWDGGSRCRELLSAYMGADDTGINATVGLRFMISSVARIMRPGCKVDSMLVLYGKQGIGKSSAVEILAGEDWSADTEIQFGDKDSYMALNGKWIYEMGEMSAFKRVSAKSARNYVTSRKDTYRAPYDKAPRDHLRQTVFIGTTNVLAVIADATGSRRFLPVEVKQVDFDGLIKDRDQLWGEAVHWYRAGEQWHLTAEEGAVLDAGIRGAAERVDPWVDPIEVYIEQRRPNLPVWIMDIAEHALNLDVAKVSGLERARIEECLRTLEYKAFNGKRMRIDGVPRRSVWLPPGWADEGVDPVE